LLQVAAQLNDAINRETEGAANDAAQKAYREAIEKARKQYEVDLHKSGKNHENVSSQEQTSPDPTIPTQEEGHETQKRGKEKNK